jgi:hypothetical protein
VLAAVRKSMAAPKVKSYRTEYHRKLLELASPPADAPPPSGPDPKYSDSSRPAALSRRTPLI